MTFSELLCSLTTGELIDTNDPLVAPWWEPGNVYETDEETYFEKLEILPPRWMQGLAFCFGEGRGPFTLFWQKDERYFVRELTDEQTEQLCRLACVPLHQ